MSETRVVLDEDPDGAGTPAETAAKLTETRAALGLALDALRQVTYLGTEEDAFYDIAAGALRALDDGTLTPSVLGRFMDRWPRCPDGCGCRLATDDADRAECGCDGPCTAECRENGYPDAPSYRDAAVKHVMDERDQARADLAKAGELIRSLERLAAGWSRGMYAARIDCWRGDAKAAASILSEGLDGYDGPEWDGTETGTEWWERTDAEEGL